MRTVPLPRASLSKEAADIFAFLLEVNKTQQVNGILRVAGGWVRDTLLGIPSNDIDIAIETLATDPPTPLITGEVFTSSIAQYQAQHQLPTTTISVIKTNPEKSKHIETAQMTVMGVPLEFCHLRHDDYTSNSRVPTVRPGTPLEDALRRDYTVNALFYNLHTETVEDFTTGLADMELKLLRTPLAPRETFLDDPLRLLRGIRFSGQLSYRLAPEVVSCAHDVELVSMMREKVSRERIGIEFAKMMGGNRPSYCGELLVATGLLHNTILQEVYFKKGKGKTNTNEIEFIRPLIPSDAPASALATLDATFQQWCIGNTQFIIDSLAIPKGYERIAVSSLGMLMPLVLGNMLQPIAEASAAGGPAATLDERVAALIMSGLKQPNVVSDNVARMLQGASMMLFRGDGGGNAALLNNMRECYANNASASSSTTVFVTGVFRELLFEVMCLLSTKTMLEAGPYVTLSLFLLGMGCSQEEVIALQCLLKKDALLVFAPTSMIPLRGDDVSVALGVEKKKTAAYIMAQRRFLLHNPAASREEVIDYLKTLQL